MCWVYRVRQVCIMCAYREHQVRTYVSGVYILGVYQVCMYHVYIMYACRASCVYQVCIRCASCVHLVCIRCASGVHHVFIWCVSGVYQVCIRCVSGVHQVCTYQVCMIYIRTYVLELHKYIRIQHMYVYVNYYVSCSHFRYCMFFSSKEMS